MEFKKYKPGQFVWYNGKRFRVTRAPKSRFCCNWCPNRHNGMDPCRKLCGTKMPSDCYPKLAPMKKAQVQ